MLYMLRMLYMQYMLYILHMLLMLAGWLASWLAADTESFPDLSAGVESPPSDSIPCWLAGWAGWLAG